MERMKYIVMSLAVILVVGSTFAMRSYSNRNLRVCSNKVNPSAGVCILQPVNRNWSTIRFGPLAQPVNADEPVYIGTLGAQCGSNVCPIYDGLVYDNN